MEKKQRIILHIGTYKTGTTSLQRFFNANRKVFSGMGICYPYGRDGTDHHHRLFWGEEKREKRKEHWQWFWPANLGSFEEELGYMLPQVKEDTCLISAEGFSNSSEDVIARVRKALSKFDVQIVVYWRRRDLFEDSWYNQLIRSGRTIKPRFFNDFVQKRHLDVWVKHFGRENIILRPYEKGQLVNGDIIADFMYNVLSQRITEEFVVPKKEENIRLHRITTEYKRLINFLPISPLEKKGTLEPLWKASRFLNSLGKNDYSAFSPGDRLQLLQAYSNDNQAIAREYLGREDGVLFFDKPPDINEQWQAYDELLEEDAFLINNYLVRYFSKTMDSIVLGIRKALEGKERGGQIAAIHLLPGIPLQGLEASLLSTLRSLIKAHQDKSDQINKIYDSVTWKTGDLISRVFRKMPDAVKKLIYRGSN